MSVQEKATRKLHYPRTATGGNTWNIENIAVNENIPLAANVVSLITQIVDQ